MRIHDVCACTCVLVCVHLCVCICVCVCTLCRCVWEISCALNGGEYCVGGIMMRWVL